MLHDASSPYSPSNTRLHRFHISLVLLQRSVADRANTGTRPLIGYTGEELGVGFWDVGGAATGKGGLDPVGRCDGCLRGRGRGFGVRVLLDLSESGRQGSVGSWVGRICDMLTQALRLARSWP